MTRLFTYCILVDDGAAPNLFWGVCTLAICKPAIRRAAQVWMPSVPYFQGGNHCPKSGMCSLVDLGPNPTPALQAGAVDPLRG